MPHLLIWIIAAASIALMLVRPRGISEYVWTGAGAILLLVLRLIPPSLAGHAVAKGLDVYLFLTGMMLLAEMGKRFGVFDWLAAQAVCHGNGSPARLFTLIYLTGTVVTVFLSNDATAVVLTPAVFAAVKRAKANPLPCLFACALIANAASFVLPISNPANLVVFHQGMPPLGQWLAMFLLPSFVSVVVTYLLMRFYFRRELRDPCSGLDDVEPLPTAGKWVLAGMGLVAITLLLASALHWNLGLPTCLAALAVFAAVLLRERESPLPLLREISWSVLPLVAALFILVAAVEQAGALDLLRHALRIAMQWPSVYGTLAVGAITGFGTNLVNNLPLGLIAGATLHSLSVPATLRRAVLIGVDLGPNLSVTGSLATILWLIALRKEGLEISGGKFLRAGLLIMPLSLLLALAAAWLVG
uniref:Arsenic transporter n=1 Tax=Acidobacterium capsulatum TaxID=33075 RepID=A0A7V4XSW3_9BACT